MASLTITYFDGNKEESRSGTRSLQLDNPKLKFSKDSDLIVGGVTMEMRLPSQVDAVNYTGCLDGLEINHHFIGSWNSGVGL